MIVTDYLAVLSISVIGGLIGGVASTFLVMWWIFDKGEW